jgi:hypothetical protein
MRWGSGRCWKHWVSTQSADRWGKVNQTFQTSHPVCQRGPPLFWLSFLSRAGPRRGELRRPLSSLSPFIKTSFVSLPLFAIGSDKRLEDSLSPCRHPSRRYFTSLHALLSGQLVSAKCNATKPPAEWAKHFLQRTHTCTFSPQCVADPIMRAQGSSQITVKNI